MKTVFLFAMLTAGIANASSPEMTKFFENEAAALNDALASDENQPEDQMYFRRISFRVRPRVAFGISSVLKLEIIPEADFIWQKPLPEGWTSYKP